MTDRIDTPGAPQPGKAAGKSPSNKRRRLTLVRLAGAALVFAVLLVVALPWILAATPLRNILLNRVLADANMQGTAGGASFGWFAPLALTDLKIKRADDSVQIDVARFQADRTWWRLVLNRPDLGHLEVISPHVKIFLSDEQTESEKPLGDRVPIDQRPTFSAIVRDGHITVSKHGAEPVIDVEGFDIDLKISRNPNGRELVIQPQTVFNHQPLSRELCEHGIQLVAPILAETATAEGSVSFVLDTFRVALDDPDPDRRAANSEVAGVLQLHEVEAGIKNPLLQQVAGLASNLLKRDIPTRAKVAKDTAVQFQFRDGRIHHAGLSFMLPELAPDLVMTSRGSVGLDESIDLQLELPLPLTLLRDGPILRRLSERPLELSVTGTLQKPIVKLPNQRDLLSELLGRLTGGDSGVRQANHEQPVESSSTPPPIESLATDDQRTPPIEGAPALNLDSTDDVVNTVGDLLQAIREAREQNAARRPDREPPGDQPPTRLLDRIRDRRQQRTQTDEENVAEDGAPAPKPKLFNRRNQSSREF